MAISQKEKARLYDELRKRAVYVPPSWGYHNGYHKIAFSPKGEADCPRNFTTALKKAVRDE